MKSVTLTTTIIKIVSDTLSDVDPRRSITSPVAHGCIEPWSHNCICKLLNIC